MSTDLPTQWAARPAGFYEEWGVFARTLLSALIQRTGEDAPDGKRVASLLLASGAAMGAAGMVAVIEANREAIERRGRSWGIPSLAPILQGVGAALGGFGGAMVTRLLTRQTQPEVVKSLQDRLAAVRRDYEEALRDRREGLFNEWTHRNAVEMLFARALATL
ncbi:MAG: hypothetical protein R3F65_27065 [bacterium]